MEQNCEITSERWEQWRPRAEDCVWYRSEAHPGQGRGSVGVHSEGHTSGWKAESPYTQESQYCTCVSLQYTLESNLA